MNKLEISKSEARKFLMKYQGLDKINNANPKEAILDFFSKVGCIQYDPLNVVGRNPDLVLQSRIQGYKPDILQEMLYSDRSLIDAWDKMMAIYKVEDWYNFYRVKEKRGEGVKRTLEYRNSIEALNLVNEIRDIIGENGPMQSNKIDLGSGGKGVWGHRKLSSAAMDYMFNIGELGIHSKNNTQKIYDLIENLLPDHILNHADPFNNHKEFIKWYVQRRIGSIGLLWDRNGSGWLGDFISNKSLRTSALKELLEENSIVSLSIEDMKETFYIRKEDLGLLESINDDFEKEVKFLAPLDNLLWDRDMIEKLFDFTYRWEVYVPVAKRRFGYYVLPVLYGDKFIGRFEPEHQRGNNPLEIKNWWWEENVEVTPEMKRAIMKAFKLFCEYLGADGVKGDISF